MSALARTPRPVRRDAEEQTESARHGGCHDDDREVVPGQHDLADREVHAAERRLQLTRPEHAAVEPRRQDDLEHREDLGDADRRDGQHQARLVGEPRQDPLCDPAQDGAAGERDRDADEVGLVLLSDDEQAEHLRRRRRGRCRREVDDALRSVDEDRRPNAGSA